MYWKIIFSAEKEKLSTENTFVKESWLPGAKDEVMKEKCNVDFLLILFSHILHKLPYILCIEGWELVWTDKLLGFKGKTFWNMHKYICSLRKKVRKVESK